MLNMRIHRENMLRDVQRNRGYLDEVEALINALPDELPEGVAMYAGNWAVYLDIPYDFEMYKRVRRCLRGWVADQVSDNGQTGEKFYVLSPPGAGPYSYTKLYITLKPGMGNSKCRVEVVGKEEVNIVRVICDEGGK